MSTLIVSSGQYLSGATISAGVSATVQSGGTLASSTLQSGGLLFISAGGSASVLHASGGQIHNDGSLANATLAAPKGQFVTINESSGAQATNLTLGAGAGDNLYYGAVETATIITSGGQQVGYGTAIGTTVSLGGEQEVFGGTASNTTVYAGGVEIVDYGTAAATTAQRRAAGANLQHRRHRPGCGAWRPVRL